MRTTKVTDEMILECQKECGEGCSSFDIKKKLIEKYGSDYELDDSTIRGRLNQIKSGKTVTLTPIKDFVIGDLVESVSNGYKITKRGWQGDVVAVSAETITITGEGLKAPVKVPKEHFKIMKRPKTATIQHEIPKYAVDTEMSPYVPEVALFENYVERDIDRRLGLALDIGKYPIAQGKQGTGKTYSFMYYAHKRGLPFFLYSGYEDFKLAKLYGDKTITNGSVVFQESMFVKATQCPSMILFDEVNAISNANTFDFHALLANRELYIKDADNGKGKTYKLHKDCKIGFAQNPKSAKYIGGNIKPSNFLGRCVYVSFPEFSQDELDTAMSKKYKNMTKEDRKKFIKFYIAACQAIDQANVPVDISIRQLNNIIDLWLYSGDLKNSLNDGMLSLFEAASQPKCKEAFQRLAEAVWIELLPKPGEKVFSSFVNKLYRRYR